MKLESIDINATINNTRRLLDEDRNVSPALKASIELLLVLVTVLINRLGLNSSNSSKPPSSDPNREKKKKERSRSRPGGQEGHEGTTLKKVDKPDVIMDIPVDTGSLPEGDCKEVGYESRQVIDIDISQIVTEYRAQILEDVNGKRYTAPFPEGVNRAFFFYCGGVEFIFGKKCFL
ncbi:MAG: DUF6444 domain-containing protein [Desulfobacterales bacterium]